MNPENENQKNPNQETPANENEIRTETEEQAPDASAQAWENYINQIEKDESAQQAAQSTMQTERQLADVRTAMGLPQQGETPPAIETNQASTDTVTTSPEDRQKAHKRVRESEEGLKFDRNVLTSREEEKLEADRRFKSNLLKGGAAAGAGLLKLVIDKKLKFGWFMGPTVDTDIKRGDLKEAASIAGNVYGALDEVEGIFDTRDINEKTREFEEKINNAKDEAEKRRLQKEYDLFREGIDKRNLKKQTNKQVFEALKKAAGAVFA